jgi:hypothetical protein
VLIRELSSIERRLVILAMESVVRQGQGLLNALIVVGLGKSKVILA